MSITSSVNETWESLTLANNFIFCKVMENNPDLCKHLLELLLHIEIDHLEPPQAERSFQEAIGSKGVRFDVYTKDSKRIFDIEMQTINKKNLPKRARYYQSVIDVSNLNAGVNYKDLKDSYVIFICLTDPFGKELPAYSFENICAEDHTVKLDDRTFKVFFNAEDCDKMESAEERAFFTYLKGNDADDTFTKNLAEKVAQAKINLEWRNQYMTFKEQFCEEIEEAQELGRKEGESIGEKRGRAEGERNKALETARNALAMGLSVEQTAKLTGLSEDEIRGL